MEIIDTNLPIKLGQMIRVKNLNKRKLENDKYVAIQVEDEFGKNERCILFTEIELADMEKIEGSFLNNLIIGRIYKFKLNKISTNILAVKNYDQSIKFLRVSNSQLTRAEKRALKNKEDLTKKSFFTNLMD